MKQFKLYEDCLFKNVANKKTVEIWDIIKMLASGEILKIERYDTGEDVTEEYKKMAESNINNGPNEPLKKAKTQKCPRCKKYATLNKYNCHSCLSGLIDAGEDLNYYAF